MAWTLWSRHLRQDPTAPDWADRDRFVLSAGHGSVLLYGLLHLFGYDLPEAELRGFRHLGSHTPGHPEYGETPGVECTTGPRGQGLAMALALAHDVARWAAVLPAGASVTGIPSRHAESRVIPGQLPGWVAARSGPEKAGSQRDRR